MRSSFGRNAPCPCGSGKKYKKCCLGKAAAIQSAANQKVDSVISGFNATNASPPSELLLKAVALHQVGRIGEAKVAYQTLLEKNPENSDALHYLGMIAFQEGDYPEAVHLIEQAIKLNETVAAFYFNLGNAHKQLKQFDSAIGAYLEAVRLDPLFSKAYLNLGNVLRDQENLDAAVESYHKALSLKPGYAEAHNNLGLALQAQDNLNAAVESYYQALSFKPDYAEAHNNLGAVLKAQYKLDAAAESFKNALSLRPNYAEAYYNLGFVHQTQGNLGEAAECYHKALSIKPDYAEARWGLAMNKIPAIYGVDGNPTIYRAEFLRELDELNAWFDAGRMELGYKAVGAQGPFYLAYQEENNRDLLSRYGTLCAKLMKYWLDKQEFSHLHTVQSGHVRIGIVSAHIYDHSVWTAIVKGWVQHLDQDRFEIHIFHVSSRQDRETDWAKSISASYKQGKGNLLQWVETILCKQLDVLIYPEIGMDPMTTRLASLRLVPLQMAAWGHPETTGLPTIDYYLSAENFEPSDAQKNYMEKLVALPHLGCCYASLPAEDGDSDFSRLCLDPTLPILLCPGTPFKYTPQYDHIFVEIARKLDQCQFIFFTYSIHELSDKLHQRLAFVFAQSGLDFNDYAVFIPWQKRSTFYSLMRRADIFLDTIGFSGFNTAMQAIECGLPIVTREGHFMRGRLASGILRRMGITELIANTEDEYIELAVKLVQDAGYRNYIRHRIETSRPVLFDDIGAVHALEDFLIEVVAIQVAR